MFRALTLLLLLAGGLPAAERITLYAGESRSIAAPGVRRLLVGNPALLEARALGQDEVLLGGKEPGQTSLMAWDRWNRKTAWEVEVTAGGLKKALIEVNVQVLEISDADGWDAGIDWSSALAGAATAGSSLPASPLAVKEQDPSLLSFGTFARGPLGARLDLLLKNNKARLVAKPRLLTVSGGSARFLSGGQVPVAQADDKGRASTQYKDYGVSLDIKPKADDEGNVSADLRVEMSDIDAANSVAINGGILPAVKTRWVETTIFVKKNGTLVIAGLLQDQEGTVSHGLPLLGQIPLLGYLFRHTSVQRRSSELVIFVTPKVLGG